MNNFLLPILIFLSIMIIRFFLYFPKYLYMKKAIQKQDSFIRSTFSEATDNDKKSGEKSAKWLEENQIEIEKLVLNTGLPNQVKSHMAPIGFRYVQQQKIPVLSNLTYVNNEIQQTIRAMLRRAKGHYKNQSINCFNPLFWIEFIVFLPREILQYFSVNKNDKIGATVIWT